MKHTIEARWGYLALLALSGAVQAACPDWAEGKLYAAGSVVQYQNQAYTALITHTAYPGTNWYPQTGSSLWRAGGSCAAITPVPTLAPQPTITPVPATQRPTVAPSPTLKPTSTPVPPTLQPSITPQPTANPGTCSDAAWNSATAYSGGQRVSYLGNRYEAKWWTQRDIPADSGEWGPWKRIGSCDTATPTPVPTVVPTVAPTPMPTAIPTLIPTIPPTTLPTPAGVLAQVTYGGRLQQDAPDQVSFSWPGVYLEGRFSGSGVGLVLDDSVGVYNVEIDGQPWGKITQPGKTTYWVNGLPAGNHTLRLSKRNETTWSSARFGGLVAAAGGQILPPAAAPLRQIEFIGDSYTAGLGAESGKRECTDAEITATSNADAAFGALTARHYGAAYQINGYSGLGLVRNYNGNLADVNYRTYYNRVLLGDAGSVWQNPGNWRPQVVVIGLGINDFSTPVNAGEVYTTATLRSTYKSAYRDFIAQLRQRYGNPYIVVSATALWPDNTLREVAQEIVNEANAQGDTRVAYFYYDGLDSLGCQWHPSVKDHQAISGKLVNLLDTLPVWQ
ncbi:Acetylxylan esterase / glucomannan deacetylase [Andreprevotia sp. IGB-42]|uniref:carbohydrate-binding protein n=1 Tax=Andreprevotia sp. IGB-42 TaxID=2497473 RepID=UPI00135AD8F8|nr:carbohydrate-binding protein [Andreprevotia sp. IGB-42]KAF0812666.1 Acetylxylan esterase / glucomannan deacetylase [Andreprevotia sp. IGB-42]